MTDPHKDIRRSALDLAQAIKGDPKLRRQLHLIKITNTDNYASYNTVECEFPDGQRVNAMAFSQAVIDVGERGFIMPMHANGAWADWVLITVKGKAQNGASTAFKGKWSLTYWTRYRIDDQVKWKKQTWICIKDHNPSETKEPGIAPNYWTLYATDGPTYKPGGWKPDEAYEQGDIVKQGGAVWIALKDVPAGKRPGSAQDDANYWELYSEKGDQGAQGLTGNTGAKGDKGANWKGRWTENTPYALDDVVKRDGSTWICIDAYNGSTTPPQDDAAHWDKHTEKGDAGSPGAKGDQGDRGNDGSPGAKGDTGAKGDKGVNWQGRWSETYGRYKVDDVVKRDGRTWICVNEHDSGANKNPVDEANRNLWVVFSDKGFNKRSADWSGGQTYETDDVVGHRGNQYRARQDHFSSNANRPSVKTSSTDNDYWELFLEKGGESQGTWSGSAEYDRGDLVQYGGETWRYVNRWAAAGIAPGSDASYWKKIADKGSDGPQGSSGAAGAKGDTGATGRGFNLRTDGWVSGRAYALDDAVVWQGATYIALQAIATGSAYSGYEPDDDNAVLYGVWKELTGRPPKYIGKWENLTVNASNPVRKGDVVRYRATSGDPYRQYISIKRSIWPSYSPGAANASTYWQEFGQDGDRGADGAAGAAGAAGAQGASGPQGSLGPQGTSGPQGASIIFRDIAWYSGSTWAKNDVIVFGNATYIALRNITNLPYTEYEPDSAAAVNDWKSLSPSSPRYRGNWFNLATGDFPLRKGDTVRWRSGGTGGAGKWNNYIAVTKITNADNPGAVPTKWDLINQDGDDGQQGAQGGQGPQGNRGQQGDKGDTGAKGSRGVDGNSYISYETVVISNPTTYNTPRDAKGVIMVRHGQARIRIKDQIPPDATVRFYIEYNAPAVADMAFYVADRILTPNDGSTIWKVSPTLTLGNNTPVSDEKNFAAIDANIKKHNFLVLMSMYRSGSSRSVTINRASMIVDIPVNPE